MLHTRKIQYWKIMAANIKQGSDAGNSRLIHKNVLEKSYT
jgi:hypothetical protein